MKPNVLIGEVCCIAKNDLSGYISVISLAAIHACRFEMLRCGGILTTPSALEKCKTAVSRFDFRQTPSAIMGLRTMDSDAGSRFDNASSASS